MDLRGLEGFLAVADHGSVSRAAAALHMTQPPLTVRLQALERELGVELLVRHSRGVELTAAGRLLAERARRVFADLARTTEMVRAVGLGTRGRLSVAVGHTVSPRLLARLTGRPRIGPDVDLTLTDVSDAEVVERVHRREAHAGLLHLPPVEPGQVRHAAGRARGLEVAVVARDRLAVVLPQGHPAGASERVDLATLNDDRVVVTDAVGEGLAAHVRAAWSAASAAPPAHYEAGSIAHALALVEAGAGVTLVPMEHTALAWPGLVPRSPRQHTGVIETAVVWRPDEDSPVLSRFLRGALSTPEPDVLGPELARPAREAALSRPAGAGP